MENINDSFLTSNSVNGPQPGLFVQAPMVGQEMLSQIPEKTDKEINIIPAESIKFVEDSITLKSGESKVLNVVSEPSNSNLPYITFESSDLSVVQVINGTAYACCEGSAIITCTTVNGLSTTIEVVVSNSFEENIDSDGEFISPVLPEEIFANEEISTVVGFTSEVSLYDVKFMFTTEGPGDANYVISDGQGHDFSFTNNGDWGGSGFDIVVEDDPYLVNTPVKVTFTEAGTYKMTVKLVYAETGETINEMVSEIEVKEKQSEVVGEFNFSFPEDVVSGEEAVGTVTFSSPSAVDGVQFIFDTERPEGGSATYKMTDTLGSEFTFENTGKWGPDSGFSLTEGYEASTQVKVTFSVSGEYTSIIKLVKVSDSSVLNEVRTTIVVS